MHLTPADHTYLGVLGERVAELRKALGLTRDQLAERLGAPWTRYYVQMLEAGLHSPPVHRVPRLAEVLQVAPGELIGRPGTAAGPADRSAVAARRQARPRPPAGVRAPTVTGSAARPAVPQPRPAGRSGSV
jgi:transcriptional regulator with XRE-family HTH domain